MSKPIYVVGFVGRPDELITPCRPDYVASTDPEFLIDSRDESEPSEKTRHKEGYEYTQLGPWRREPGSHVVEPFALVAVSDGFENNLLRKMILSAMMTDCFHQKFQDGSCGYVTIYYLPTRVINHFFRECADRARIDVQVTIGQIYGDESLGDYCRDLMRCASSLEDFALAAIGLRKAGEVDWLDAYTEQVLLNEDTVAALLDASDMYDKLKGKS